MRDPMRHVEIAFFRNGRLVGLPRRRTLMLAACAHLAQRFARDRLYPESEVNRVLAEDAPDPATLRRLLVDEGYLARDRGIYWRVDDEQPSA